MTARPTQREVDELHAEIFAKVAINNARKAAGAREPRLPLSESATKTLFALHPELAPKERN
jgi:hypothetical protein